jgi:hypothetical protein
MSRDIREAAGAAEQIHLRIADAKIPAIEGLAIQKTFDKAKADLRLAKAVREKIPTSDEFNLNINPIEKVLKIDNVPGPGLTDY